jgi:hypothetical protein
MNESEISRLRYRRQYFLGLSGMKCPFVHNSKKVNDKYILFSHVDLLLSEYVSGDKTLLLLGDIYDYEKTDKKNIDILIDLIDNDFDVLLEKTSKYAGRYVLIYCKGDEIKLLHDASASRKIFYTKKNGEVVCASTQHLLADVSDFRRTTNKSLLEYYQSIEFQKNLNSNIGNLTYYDEIRQVLPNHYLSINPFEVRRYWPNKELRSFSTQECIERSAIMIKGFISAAVNRYELMIPITSGYDSRIFLAATKDFTEKVFYYLNNSDEVKKTSEDSVPKKMLAKLNIKFNMLEIDQHVDDEFREIYYQNNPLANQEFLPIIFNYYRNFSEKLNLPAGIIPIVKALYHSSEKEITPEILARSFKVDKFEVAHSFYRDWYDQTKKIAEQFQIDIFDLLYWEDRTCNWGTQVQLDKDIAQEEFMPFNSRDLIATMLVCDKQFRQKPYFGLNKGIIKMLWPELLHFPFNPSFNHTIKEILIFLKLYEPFMFMKKKLSGKAE